MSHIRRLNTIYHEKHKNRKVYEDNEDDRAHFMMLHLKNKEKDSERKQKLMQTKIDYEN